MKRSWTPDWRTVWHRVYRETGSIKAADDAVYTKPSSASDFGDGYRSPSVDRAWRVIGYGLAVVGVVVLVWTVVEAVGWLSASGIPSRAAEFMRRLPPNQVWAVVGFVAPFVGYFVINSLFGALRAVVADAVREGIGERMGRGEYRLLPGESAPRELPRTRTSAGQCGCGSPGCRSGHRFGRL